MFFDIGGHIFIITLYKIEATVDNRFSNLTYPFRIIQIKVKKTKPEGIAGISIGSIETGYTKNRYMKTSATFYESKQDHFTIPYFSRYKL